MGTAEYDRGRKRRTYGSDPYDSKRAVKRNLYVPGTDMGCIVSHLVSDQLPRASCDERESCKADLLDQYLLSDWHDALSLNAIETFDVAFRYVSRSRVWSRENAYHAC